MWCAHTALWCIILTLLGAQTVCNAHPIETCPLADGGTWGQATQSTAARHVSRKVTKQDLIVRFKAYKVANVHKSALSEALAGSPYAWSWVSRDNPASAIPTDFGLLRVLSTEIASVTALLALVPGVKDVHLDKAMRRELALPSPEPVEPLDGGLVRKRPGRLQTRPTIGLWEDDSADMAYGRELLAAAGPTLPVRLGADKIWEQGHSGKGIKMGVFDTGIRGNHSHLRNIKERTNWTLEPTLEDGLGHGSFVAGVIAGIDPECPGLAPDIDMHFFRVFTNDQVSYTSWFLDAFNYAIASSMDIVNLSIGGPDHLDAPFVEKVAEVTSAGIIMISAIGNDGPFYGTLNNPADQADVIGVGGIDFSDRIAPFSSRGLTSWDFPRGVGHFKPDVVAYGKDVRGSHMREGCRSLSGTSVASPVVAGAVGLLASTMRSKAGGRLNPAAMKQALLRGAARLPGVPAAEQGAGRIDLAAAAAALAELESAPRASVHPEALDLADCPYMWPYCGQPLYAEAMPTLVNLTILNGAGLVGRLEGSPVYVPTDEPGRALDVQFEASEVLWPWSGYLALYIRVRPDDALLEATAHGEVRLTVVSAPGPGEKEDRRSDIVVPLTVPIIPTPPRKKRILWDQYHSIAYPPAYIPRDDLTTRQDILDWHGDHPYNNFHGMLDHLRERGYYLEILGSPLTCFNASQYGALLIVDSEEEFYKEEIQKLRQDVDLSGLGLIVFADWYDLETMKGVRFYDDNTRSWWEAATGGANVPALNDLLQPFGIGLGGPVLEGTMELPGGESVALQSGTAVMAAPQGAWLYTATTPGVKGKGPGVATAALALLRSGMGTVSVFGDSNCLDSSHQKAACWGLLDGLLAFAGGEPEGLSHADGALGQAHGSLAGLPARNPDYDFKLVSRVLTEPLRCYPNGAAGLPGALPIPGPRPGPEPRKGDGGSETLDSRLRDVAAQANASAEAGEGEASKHCEFRAGSAA